MPDVLTFQCDFGGGVSVTIRFDPAQYLKDRNQRAAQKIEWNGTPTRAVVPRYLEWMHTVNAEIAKAINGKYLYIAQLGPKPSDREAWIYYPDGKREKA